MSEADESVDGRSASYASFVARHMSPKAPRKGIGMRCEVLFKIPIFREHERYE